MEVGPKDMIPLLFKNTSFKQVYFEAVANAFDAGANEITINIDINSFKKTKSLKLKISDNGYGFIDENFKRFQKLLIPKDQFHKGIGRLMFLNYFDRVEVNSVYGSHKRDFVFSNTFEGKNNIFDNTDDMPSGTSFLFLKFSNRQLSEYNDIRPEAIKKELIEHFFPTLYQKKKNGTNFEITIKLDTQETNQKINFYPGEEKITVDDIIDLQEDSFPLSTSLLNDEIKLYYSVDKDYSKQKILTSICIDGRTINYDLISDKSIPDSYKATFIVESEIFQGKVDSARQNLTLFKSPYEEKQFKKSFRKKVSEILSANIPAIQPTNEKIRNEFETKYPHLLGYFSEDYTGLIEKKEALNEAQERFFKEQKDILEADSLDNEKFDKALNIASRLLTEYILYRTFIIEKLKKVDLNCNEDVIHNLIVPRYKTFNEEDFKENIFCNNAWLLDDKYMSYNTILSEKTMKETIKAITLEDDNDGGNGRPDITLIFSDDLENSDKVDVVVVELKKQTDDEKENTYAINQLLQRAEKLVKYNSKIQRIWYYAILQINETFKFRLRQQGWTSLCSSGHLFYKEFFTPNKARESVLTPIFILSYDALIQDAESRNKSFLEVLKKGIKKFKTDFVD